MLHVCMEVTMRVVFILIAERHSLHGLMQVVTRYISSVSSIGPFFRMAETETRQQLEASLDDLRALGIHLLQNKHLLVEVTKVDPTMKSVIPSDAWYLYPFYLFSRPVIRSFPMIQTLIPDSTLIPFLRERQFYSCYLNVFAPHLVSDWYRGECKGYIKLWIPLFEEGIVLDFAQKNQTTASVELKQNQLFLFDHTYIHRFRNLSSEPQIVLCLELIHPLESEEQRQVVSSALDIISKHHLVDGALSAASM